MVPTERPLTRCCRSSTSASDKGGRVACGAAGGRSALGRGGYGFTVATNFPSFPSILRITAGFTALWSASMVMTPVTPGKSFVA